MESKEGNNNPFRTKGPQGKRPFSWNKEFVESGQHVNEKKGEL